MASVGARGSRQRFRLPEKRMVGMCNMYMEHGTWHSTVGVSWTGNTVDNTATFGGYKYPALI